MDVRTFFRSPVFVENNMKQGVYCGDEDENLYDDAEDEQDEERLWDKKERVKRRKRAIELLERAYWDQHPTHFLETTRFNQASMEVNRQARGDGCLYGNPLPLKKRPQPFRLILELNNDTNRIDGIGLISNKSLLRGKNTLLRDVYENRLFNQNVYRGAYRLDRSILDEYSELSAKIFQHLDEGCFHGFYHVKRGNSISKLPFVHILAIQKNFGVDLVDFIRSILKKTYEK